VKIACRFFTFANRCKGSVDMAQSENLAALLVRIV